MGMGRVRVPYLSNGAGTNIILSVPTVPIDIPNDMYPSKLNILHLKYIFHLIFKLMINTLMYLICNAVKLLFYHDYYYCYANFYLKLRQFVFE